MTIRGGIKEVGQPGNFGLITDLATENFSINGTTPFNIKNNTESNISLNIRPAGNSDDFVSTVIYPGWNVEICTEIEAKVGITDTDLSWGY